jgi:hypothetical protein
LRAQQQDQQEANKSSASQHQLTSSQQVNPQQNEDDRAKHARGFARALDDIQNRRYKLRNVGEPNQNRPRPSSLIDLLENAIKERGALLNLSSSKDDKDLGSSSFEDNQAESNSFNE